MADKIFVVVAFGGHYEDAWENNLFASLDLEKLQNYILVCETRIEHLKYIKSHVDQFFAQYDKANQFDRSAEFEPLQQIPKWPSGQDQRLITKEMRAERTSIQAYNAEVQAKNNAKYAAYYTARNQAALDLAKSIGFTDELENVNLLHSFLYKETEPKFRIDEIELI